MGLRGPAPKPTAVGMLSGSRRAKYRKDEPTAFGKPACPKWLDEREKKLWRELVRVLTTMRVLSKGDCQMLSRYCHLWYRWRDMEEFIKEKGGISYDVTDQAGNVIHRRYPEASEARELATQLTRMEQEFGLSPASRARVQMQLEAKGEDETHTLLSMDSSYTEN